MDAVQLPQGCRAKPLRGDKSVLTIKSSADPGTHLINLKK